MKKATTNNTEVKAEVKIVDTIENKNGEVIEIMEGIEMPEHIKQTRAKSPFRMALESLQIGQCFDVDVLPKHHYTFQKQIGIKLVSQKMGNGKTRIWRKS